MKFSFGVKVFSGDFFRKPSLGLVAQLAPPIRRWLYKKLAKLAGTYLLNSPGSYLGLRR